MNDKAYSSFVELVVQLFEISKCNPSARVPGAPKQGNLCLLQPARTPKVITSMDCH